MYFLEALCSPVAASRINPVRIGVRSLPASNLMCHAIADTIKSLRRTIRHRRFPCRPLAEFFLSGMKWGCGKEQRFSRPVRKLMDKAVLRAFRQDFCLAIFSMGAEEVAVCPVSRSVESAVVTQCEWLSNVIIKQSANVNFPLQNSRGNLIICRASTGGGVEGLRLMSALLPGCWPSLGAPRQTGAAMLCGPTSAPPLSD